MAFKVFANGKQYDRPEEMPAAVRRAYESAMQVDALDQSDDSLENSEPEVPDGAHAITRRANLFTDELYEDSAETPEDADGEAEPTASMRTRKPVNAYTRFIGPAIGLIVIASLALLLLLGSGM